MDALSFDPYDLERLRLTLEGAVRVRRPSEFYLWAQGALQSFLPHETLVCVFEGSQVGGTTVELFSRAVLSPEAETALLSPSDGLWAALRRDWLDQGQRPCAHPRPDSPAALQGSALVHGVGGALALSPCLLVFLGMPAPPGPRERYLAELLLPHLYMALLRQRQVTPLAGAATGLSARQRQVLEGVRGGKTNAQIAGDLGISPVTVKHHIQQALRKLSVNNRAEAAAVTSSLGEAGRA